MNLNRTLLLEIREWARGAGRTGVAIACSVLLHPEGHRPERLEDCRRIALAAWEEHLDEEPTVPRTVTPQTRPMPAQTIAEVDEEWRASRS